MRYECGLSANLLPWHAFVFIAERFSLLKGKHCKSSYCPGHRKAVSYVRYLNNSELVSASTDSTLRMWDTKACTAARTFSGHNNEKNFVGLSVDADFIACGSESNEVSLPS